jgi:cytochrome b
MPKPAKTEPDQPVCLDAHQSPTMVRVWDLFVRIFHWCLVLSFGLAWLTAKASAFVHQTAGYVAGTLILLRVLWGVAGPGYARFSQFVRDPVAVVHYLISMLRGREPRYVGHNPAGGAMVVTLLALICLTALTGWMMTTDTYFGVEWVEGSHDILADVILVLVFLHVGGVGLASLRHRENLVKAMITGQKRQAAADDIV